MRGRAGGWAGRQARGCRSEGFGERGGPGLRPASQPRQPIRGGGSATQPHRHPPAANSQLLLSQPLHTLRQAGAKVCGLRPRLVAALQLLQRRRLQLAAVPRLHQARGGLPQLLHLRGSAGRRSGKKVQDRAGWRNRGIALLHKRGAPSTHRTRPPSEANATPHGAETSAAPQQHARGCAPSPGRRPPPQTRWLRR